MSQDKNCESQKIQRADPATNYEFTYFVGEELNILNNLVEIGEFNQQLCFTTQTLNKTGVWRRVMDVIWNTRKALQRMHEVMKRRDRIWLGGEKKGTWRQFGRVEKRVQR